MFDSPFDACPVCREIVLLDQTQAQCAREHGCTGACPLEAYFTGVPCVATTRKVRTRPPHPRSPASP
jgi:hypothetical protein